MGKLRGSHVLRFISALANYRQSVQLKETGSHSAVLLATAGIDRAAASWLANFGTRLRDERSKGIVIVAQTKINRE